MFRKKIVSFSVSLDHQTTFLFLNLHIRHGSFDQVYGQFRDRRASHAVKDVENINTAVLLLATILFHTLTK